MFKEGINQYVPQITGTDVKIGAVDVAWLTGRAELRDLVIGNPDGFRGPTAIEIPNAAVTVQSRSLFQSKIVLHSIEIQRPFITYERKLKGSNLTDIQSNVEDFVARARNHLGINDAPRNGDRGNGKTLQVDELTIRGAQVKLALTMLGGRGAKVSLPDINLKDLGRDRGISGPELFDVVLKTIVKAALRLTDK